MYDINENTVSQNAPCRLIVQVVLLPLSSTITLVAAAMFEARMKIKRNCRLVCTADCGAWERCFWKPKGEDVFAEEGCIMRIFDELGSDRSTRPGRAILSVEFRFLAWNFHFIDEKSGLETRNLAKIVIHSKKRRICLFMLEKCCTKVFEMKNLDEEFWFFTKFVENYNCWHLL